MSKRNEFKNQRKSSLTHNEIVSSNKTITMTEMQLERVIKTAVKTALRDLRAEEELQRNEVDELKEARATFTSLCFISSGFLLLLFVICIVGIITCISIMYQSSFGLGALIVMLFSAFMAILSGVSMYEIWTTKKIVVIQTVFTAIMATSSLIVSIVAAYFAYKSIK